MLTARKFVGVGLALGLIVGTAQEPFGVPVVGLSARVGAAGTTAAGGTAGVGAAQSAPALADAKHQATVIADVSGVTISGVLSASASVAPGP